MSDFDTSFWDQHWAEHDGHDDGPNPYVIRETADLKPGSALDAGCGSGIEAVWLAQHGWQVTGVDIADAAIELAQKRAARADVSAATTWVASDLTQWSPAQPFDLVMTNYAHTPLPQVQLYKRLADWVRPGGTLLLVGHGHEHLGTHSSERIEAVVEGIRGLELVGDVREVMGLLG